MSHNVKLLFLLRNRYQDSPRSTSTNGRPNKVTTPEMLKKIHKMVLDDRWLKMHELTDTVDISKSAMHRILVENLDTRKLCPRWVPRVLTMERKLRSENVSVECLVMIRRNKAEFLHQFITMVKHGSITSHLRQKNSQNNILKGENCEDSSIC